MAIQSDYLKFSTFDVSKKAWAPILCQGSDVTIILSRWNSISGGDLPIDDETC